MSTEFSKSKKKSTHKPVSKTTTTSQAHQNEVGKESSSQADGSYDTGAANLTDILDGDAGLGAAELKNKSMRVLSVCIFEDSYALGQMIVDKLRDSGHEVDYFSDIDETLSSLAAKRYDLVIIGESNDGAELASVRLIKTTEGLYTSQKWEFLIMVLTSDTSPENIKALTALGANLVMAKRVNGKLNNNIFEVAHIISTMPNKRSAVAGDAESDSIPVLVSDLPALSESHSKQPEPNVSAQASPPVSESEESTADLGSEVVHSEVEPHSAKQSKLLPTIAKGVAYVWNRWSSSLMLGAGVLLVFATILVIWQRSIEPIPVDVVEVRQGMLSQSTRGSGRIVSRKQVDLTSVTSGQLASVFVEEGSRVNKGDVLAILDDREAKINVNRAEAELANIESDIDLKRRSLSQLKKASIAGGVTSVMVRDLEAGLNSAKAQYRIAEEELSAAKLEFERLRVVAPFDAVIVESNAVEGLWVEPPAPLFKLIDPARFEAAIMVNGDDARGIVVGQQVFMSSGALADEEWNGEVVQVSFESKDLIGDEPILIYAELGPNSPFLRYGQLIEARIITETSENAIKLPFEAIFERDGEMMVAIVDDDRVKLQPVQTGLRDLTEIEIVSGLRSGQPVILEGANFEQGARVTASLIKDERSGDESGFPYREKYSDVAILSTEQLRKSYEDVLIVDVRSQFEFDVVHINKAVNIPLSSDKFLVHLESLRSKNDSTPLVFYCNGHTCTKSYKAVRKAVEAGFDRVFAYDSGIFDWLRANRDYTKLLNISPAPLDKLVSNDYFQSRLLNFDKFKEKAAQNNAVVIDIRDELQRATKLALSTKELPLDQLLIKLNAGQYKDKQLLIFDAVGKQVRWLQYVLKDNGYENYYFLRDGIDGISG